MAVDRALWWSVWWPWAAIWMATVLAVVATVTMFAMRKRFAPRREVLGVPLYLDEESVMDLYQVGGFGDALVKEVTHRIGVIKRGQLRLPGLGELGGGVEHDREVVERYMKTNSAITVVGVLMDALRATGNVVRVNLWTRTVERGPAVEPGAATASLGELDAFVSLKGKFRHDGQMDGTTVLWAPFGPLPDGPRVRLECRTQGIKHDVPAGTFNAVCLGRVMSWDGQEWVVHPIAVFQ